MVADVDVFLVVVWIACCVDQDRCPMLICRPEFVYLELSVRVDQCMLFE